LYEIRAASAEFTGDLGGITAGQVGGVNKGIEATVCEWFQGAGTGTGDRAVHSSG
jgi:hypothetical protein